MSGSPVTASPVPGSTAQPLLARDREFAERDTEIPTSSLAAQRERHLAFGHDLRLRGLHGACMSFRRCIGAENFIDAVHVGEFAPTVFDRGLTDGDATALRR